MLTDELPAIDLPPGVYRNGTKYQVRNRWYEASLVRWVAGRMRPVGGWVKVVSGVLAGRARKMLSWTDNTAGRWLAIGTTTKLYVTHADGAALSDVTPVGFVTGSDDATESTGYSGGNYGSSTYGTIRAGGTYLSPGRWSLDTWGERLVGCSRPDGKIYEWALNTGTPAAAITNAPINCTSILVTDQRHILALGAGAKSRRVEWCDKENNTIWAAGATNEAGGIDLQSQGAIMAGCRVRGRNLIVTTTDAHCMDYIGQPFIYSRELVGQNCGTKSPLSLISVGDRAFWVGDGLFYEFDGAIVRPLECDVSDLYFNILNKIQIEKVAAGHNPRFGEVWWFYPTNEASEPTRYVSYNYEHGFWMTGILRRTAWDAGTIFGYPHAVSQDRYLYRQEDEWTDNGAARYSSIFADSAVLELGTGARVGHVNQILPDEETSGETSLTFKTRFAPNDPTEYIYGPYTIRSDGFTDVRVAGRQMSMTVKPVADGDFSIGRLRIDVRPGGKR
jgi:hypothetical protein